MSGLADPLNEFVSIVVDAVLLTVCAPIILSLLFIVEADSLSANSILYNVTLQVPAVPLAPLSLTSLPLISAVNVANGVLPELVVNWLYVCINASVPL